MDEREQLHLKQLLENKRDTLQNELDELRERRRHKKATLSDPYSSDIRGELKMIERWLVEFTDYAFAVAKGISRSRKSYEFAFHHFTEMVERFDPHIAICTSMLNRARVDQNTQQKNQSRLRKIEFARMQIDTMVAAAEFNFARSELAYDPAQIAKLDDWIRLCGATSYKDGWRMISQQSDLPKPKLKLLIERWKVVYRDRKRGRPRKVKP